MSPWSLPTGDVGTPWPKPDRHVPFPSNSWPKSSIARSRGRRAIGLPARSSSAGRSGRGPGRVLAECPAAGCPGVGRVVAAGGPRGLGLGPRRAISNASESAAWRRSWKSPASGTRRGRSNRCWCRWPRRPRDLLKADRASIFLWDRANHCLIGRPALGVKGGELRVADDRGVVGRVLQSGQPVRVDGATQPEAIDHSVDTQTALSHAHAAVRSPANAVGRAIRRVRTDQQAFRHVHAGRSRGPRSNWPPTRPWPWKTPRTARS